MRTIWKFPILDGGKLKMPAGARPLCAQYQQYQGGTLCLWAEVDTEQHVETRTVFIIGTGHDKPERGRRLCRYGSAGAVRVARLPVTGGPRPMKIRLDVGALEVESFAVGVPAAKGGTVLGNDSAVWPDESVGESGCVPCPSDRQTCPRTCPATCDGLSECRPGGSCGCTLYPCP